MALIRIVLLYLCAFLAATPLIAATQWTEHQRIQPGDYGSIDVGGFDLNIAGQVHAITYNGNITDAINDNGEMADTFLPEHWEVFNPDDITTYGLTNEYFYDEQVALNPAFKALMVMIATPYLGGLGLGNLVSGAHAAVQAGVTAFGNHLALGMMEGAITGNFDIGDILKNAAMSGVSAGFGNYLTASFNIPGLSEDVIFGIGDQTVSIDALINGGLDNLIEASISSGLYGGSVEDIFLQMVLNDSVNFMQAGLQNLIGDIFENDQYGGEGSLGHVLMHGMVGCATAELLDGHCASGFAAGAAQALYAGAVDPDAVLRDEQQHLNNVELIGGFFGYLTSGSEAQNVNNAAAIARSGFKNNYLGHTDRAQAAKLLDELAELCAAVTHGDSGSCFGARAKEIQEELRKLELISAKNTIDMINSCTADVNSSTCQAHMAEANAYKEWVDDDSWLNPQMRDRFDVGAEHVANVDWGGNLDTLALDVLAKVQSGELTQEEANQMIIDRAVGYDGRMNLTVGLGSVGIGVTACALAGGGTACAALAGGLALAAESNTIIDGAVTVWTGEPTDGYIQAIFEARGYTEEEAREYESLVELGLAVATFSAETGALVLTTRGGGVLKSIDNAPQPLTLPDNYDVDTEISGIRNLGDPNAAVVNTDRVVLVNGRVPINSQQYAGTTFELSGELGQKYPHGVPFSGAGFPDFSRYSQANVRIELTGSRSADFAAANRAAGLARTPDGMTWHHHQDAGYMQLVPTDLHRTVRHTGGIATGR